MPSNSRAGTIRMNDADDVVTLTSTVQADGFAFSECPRWRDGSLWFSDQHGGTVYRLDPSGSVQPVVDVPGHPSGLGWLPSGELVVVSMQQHCLYTWDAGRLTRRADLSALQGGPCNDMVVDRLGRAYVGNIGFDYYGGAPPATTDLLLVDLTRGVTSVAAPDVFVPNGSVISPDGRELVVAESFRHQLTRFTIEEDGQLTDRAVFADLDDLVPDGICLDAEGAIWFAAIGSGVLRVTRDGIVTDRVTTSRQCAYASALGGPDLRDLYLCTSDTDRPAETGAARRSAIERIRVRVPGVPD